ncbi:zf-HC2 domain-containing protein [Actinosynnema sp. NPDC047251]|uniref:Transmembrane anti-sigma factor n=1 Tax=Saccharothrix espanaensis (strain ATCC 51144 / DSM 44229 / JCM 9112 / NBRC 15066 / NRRL 15764) TaxID=1179773 RepID=K0JR28_SACES|nr:Transmembrane anti-sigma factor [Saccharothrix espanaensis]CCH28211.1 Transmembrane anti-sigma factor [Saccharothrix espanaensis DSM 44229]
MTDLRGWGLSEQHLLPDAVVAFVDGELSASAHGRASAHLARCPFCAAEAYSQQQARSAVRTAETPCAPAGLLAKLGAIPQEVDLPSAPDGLAVTEDGQLVTVQRPDRVTFGTGPVLGQSRPFGTGSRFGSRARQGAGVVVSGLMLGALALVVPGSEDPATTPAQGTTLPPNPAVAPALVGDGARRGDVLRPVSTDTGPRAHTPRPAGNALLDR